MNQPSDSTPVPSERDEKEIPHREDVGLSALHEVDRGRLAETPEELPSKGWKDVLWRTRKQVAKDNLSIIAAGVGFYSFVAVAPVLAVIIAMYGLFANAADLSHHLDLLARIVPQAVMPLLQDQLARITKNNTAAGISAIVGVIIALYSSASATKAMIAGMNIAYDEREKRNFFHLNLLAIVLTFCGILGVVITVALLAVAPSITRYLGMEKSWVIWLRWPVLVGLFMTGVSVLYRVGPCRRGAKWRWITWGAALSGLLWILGSAGFSLYVAKFGRYEKTYGSLGAVVVFLLWFYLSAYVVLIGAELNAELERQTVKDTTPGPPKELGQRGAFAADTVGQSSDAPEKS